MSNMLNWILLIAIAGAGGGVIGQVMPKILGESLLTSITGYTLAFIWGWFICSVFQSGGLI